MIHLLIALAAWGAPGDLGELHERPARQLGTFLHDGRTWAAYEAGAEADVHLQCRGGAAPERLVVLPERGSVTLLEAPLPEAVMQRGHWVLPQPGPLARFWAIDRPDCRLTLVRARPSGDAYDHAEQHAAGSADLPAPLNTVVPHAPWIQHLLDRPMGGFVTVRQPLRPDVGERVRVEGSAWEGEQAWDVGAHGTWTVRGPARVEISGRALGPPAALCLAVDGVVAEGACVVSAPIEDLRLVGDDLRAEVPKQGDSALGRLVRWRVLVPAGRNEISVDRPMVAIGRVDELDHVPMLGPWPALPAVLATPDGWNLPRAPYRADDPVERTVLLGPARWTALQTDAISWLQPGDVPATATWWDAEARAAIVLSPSSAGTPRCTLTFSDGSSWTTAQDRGLHTFVWTGPGAPPPAPPVMEGCEGRLRTVGGVAQHPDRFVAVPLDVLERNQTLSLVAPVDTQGGLVLRAHPADGVSTLVVEVAGEGGATTSFTLHIPPGAPGVMDADGRAWGPGADLGPIDRLVTGDLGRLTIRSSARVALRVLSEVPAWVDPDAPLVVLAEAPSPVAIAGAADDVSRGRLLQRRGMARASRGDPRGGLSDLLLADALGTFGDLRTLQRAASDVSRGVWAQPNTWVPVDEVWVPTEVATPERLAAAARADAVSVARSLERSPPSLRYWLAAARTQTLTETDVLVAWSALLNSPAALDADDPRLGALRAWTRPTPATAWEGTDGARWVGELLPPEDLPFPDRWPDVERIALTAGWRTALGRQPARVSARCLALDPLALLEPCEVRQLGPGGALLASWPLSSWGAATELEPVQVAGSVFTVKHSGRVRAELRAPVSSERWRPVRVLTDGVARLDVAGPTVVDLQLARAGGGVARVAVEGTTPLELALSGTSTRTAVACERERCVLRVVAPPGTLLDATVLEAQTPSSEPPEHRTLVMAVARGVVPESPAVVELPTARRWVPSPPHAVDGPPLALLFETRVGVGGTLEEDVEAAGAVPLRGMQRVGLLSRPLSAPWWIDLRLGAIESLGQATLAEARLWTEVAWSRPMWRGYVAGELLTRSSFSDDLVTLLRGRVDVSAAVRPRAVVDVRWTASLVVSRRVGLWLPELAAVPAQDLLWSNYRENHPLQGFLKMEVRTFPSAWVRTSLHAYGVSNAPGDTQPIDAAGAGLDLRFGVPAFRAGIDLALEGRFIDAHRLGSYLSPLLGVELRGTVWPHDDVPVDLVARVAWQAAFRRISADLGVDIGFGRRPGLMERAPQRMDAAFVSAWGEPDRFVPLPAP